MFKFLTTEQMTDIRISAMRSSMQSISTAAASIDELSKHWHVMPDVIHAMLVLNNDGFNNVSDIMQDVIDLSRSKNDLPDNEKLLSILKSCISEKSLLALKVYRSELGGLNNE
jgi:hypothetical protein